MIPLSTFNPNSGYCKVDNIEHIVCKTDDPDIDLLFPVSTNTEITRQLWCVRECVDRPPKDRYFRSPRDYAKCAWPNSQRDVAAFMRRSDVQAWERQHMQFQDNPVEFMRNTNTRRRTYIVRNSRTGTETVRSLDDQDRKSG